MKRKVILAISLLYMAAFSNFLLEIIGLDKSLYSFILLIIDCGIIYLGFSTINNNTINNWALFFIGIITSLNYLSHEYSFVSYINGLREIVNIVLIFIFLEKLTKSVYQFLFWNKFKRFMKIFLIVQIPITFSQFSLYGAGDEVGGSLGVGNSGVLTLITIIMVFVIIKDERRKMGMKAYYNSIFLIPLFLNETKISFLLIPVMFLFLIDIKRLGPALAGISFGILFFIILNTFYSDQGKKSENPFEEIFTSDYLEYYLLSDVGEIGSDVPRFTKIILISKLLSQNTTDFILGAETGAFKGGNVISKSDFSRNNEWLLKGSRPYLFYLLVTGGWTLFLLIVSFIYIKLYSNRHNAYDSKFTLLLSVIFTIMLFYNDAFRNQLFIFVFAYFALMAKGHFNHIKKNIKRQGYTREIKVLLNT